MRMTPWESCPRRLARTRRWAIQAASLGGAPSPSKMRVAVLSRRPESMVGMSDTIPHVEGRARAPLRPARLAIARPRAHHRDLLLPARGSRPLRRGPSEGLLRHRRAFAPFHLGPRVSRDG